MNIAFMGTPNISKEILEKIYEKNKNNIKLVVTKEDKIRSRGKKKKATEVKEFALKHGIDVLTPKLIDKEFLEKFKKYNIDLVIVVAYGKILPKEFLDIPKFGCFNIHFSLLPKYRGASPIQSAILNGEKLTGVNIIKMNEKMDEGDIIFSKNINIEEIDGTKEIFEKALDIVKENINKIIEDIENGKVEYVKQNGEAIYCGKISKDMTSLDFSQDVEKLNNMVRAFNMEYGAKTSVFGFNVKIWKSKIKKDVQNIQIENGKILIEDKNIYIKAKNGFLEILELQPESKGKMKNTDFFNGYMHKIDKNNVKIV